jgi:MFS family permease
VVLNVFVPVFLQLRVGLPASTAGLLMMTVMFSYNVGAGLSGQIAGRVRRYKLTPLVGITLALAGAVALGFAAGRSNLIAIEMLLTVIGFGAGTVPPVATVALQNAVELGQLGAATACLNFARSLFSTLSVAVFGAVLTAGLVSPDALQIAGASLAPHDAAALGRAFQIVFFGTSAGFAFSLLAMWAMPERPLQESRTAAAELR